jgi:hypothetical protein
MLLNRALAKGLLGLGLTGLMSFASLPAAHTAPKPAVQRNWETGKLIDTQQSRALAGFTGNKTSFGVYGNVAYRVTQNYMIEGPKYTYFCEEPIRWRWSKPANLTVNGPVQYAVDKNKLYVLDEDSKEHTLKIMRKELKP